jgi:hypothetical protein
MIWAAIGNDNYSGYVYSTIGSSPVTLTGFSNPIQISSGGTFALFLNAAGQVAGFGDNPYYQLASTGSDQLSASLTKITGLSGVIQVSTSGTGAYTQPGSSCALFSGGTVSCWGSNSSGQLGQGTSGTLGQTTSGSNNATPTAVSSITNAVALFGVGYVTNGFCALLKTGSYICWGDMYSGFNTPTITTISGLP